LNIKQNIVFNQSLRDFPCPVVLGNKNPVFSLYRFKKPLRFLPLDDEGFTMRCDRRRLLYKGQKKSHRFTILGDTSFEYDCILQREPKSNVISLILEGAENFDFFRQPDFVKEPFLKGSYAVYKKETLIGEGTGKLCHIHRPEIIDARGRRCWGDLSIADNVLNITIPEKWLGEAKYPVIVDPTIGTATVGSQTLFYDEDNEGWYDLFFELALGVNRFIIPEVFNGNGTAYVYAYNKYNDDRCKPVLYSDNSNKPLNRLSMNEGLFDVEINSNKPAGWRAANFQTNTSIPSGTYVWFGFFCDYFISRFDYGAKCYREIWEGLYTDIPNVFPMFDANYYYDFKLSMYFNYSSIQNYVRILTQGVTVSDTRKLKSEYYRTLKQTTETILSLKRFSALYIKLDEFIKGLENIFISNSFLRFVCDKAVVFEVFMRIVNYIKKIFDNIKNEGNVKSGWVLKRFISDKVQVIGVVFRGLIISVLIFSRIFIRDYLFGRFLKAREELKIKSAVCREIIIESKII
jgi:hypothetical protein